MKKITPVAAVVPEEPLMEDLEVRLNRLRLRMQAEGREAAVIALDKEIARARRRRASKPGE